MAKPDAAMSSFAATKPWASKHTLHTLPFTICPKPISAVI